MPKQDPRRRELSIESWPALRKELDAIEAADTSGTLVAAGGWTAGENLEHCAKMMEWSMDGFPDKPPPPWYVRAVAKTFIKPIMLKSVMALTPAPQGIKFPKSAEHMAPIPDAPFAEGAARIRAIADRVDAGDRFEIDSPLFGPMSHEQWSNLHLCHCSLHWSFLHPDGHDGG